MSLDHLELRSTGEVVLLTSRAELGVLGKFDVTWFIPALVKYQGLIGEVLAASNVPQIFALAPPLIFQVVIRQGVGP